ncbi:MAG: hypothetical protein COV45_03265 [Deltaproteobacteria bacterium CG11_big_fil_rev_8_21_14_0_20_47_16]|nr:MAG: hypothetical protein COV45_03265 [Deltaproteobacteria bacterium CG11_big_fil_rev_8_21_14_0_20_47_16]
MAPPINTFPPAHAALIEYAQRTFGAGSLAVHDLGERPQRVWTAATLVNQYGVPPLMAVAKVFEHPPLPTMVLLAEQLGGLFQQTQVTQVLQASNPTNIASIMTAAGFTTFSQALTPQMNGILRGTQFFMQIIHDHLDEAIRAGQKIGVEIEFSPHGTAQTRDDAYLALKAQLESKGYTVTLHEGDRDFVYGAKPGIFPTTRGYFDWNKQIVAELLVATSSIMHTITRSEDDSVRLRAKSEDVEGAFAEMYERVAEALGLDSVDSVKTLMARGAPEYTQKNVYLLKDDSGDIAKVEVELLGNNKARLTGLNCTIYDPAEKERIAKPFIDIDTTGTTPAERFKAVDVYLRKKVARTAFAKKVDRYSGLSIKGIDGQFKIVVEADPDLELITPKLDAGQIDIVEHLIAGLHTAGFEGTRAKNVVGVHVHGGIPLVFRTGDGQLKPTVAPLLNLMRAYGRDAHLITAAIPTHPNREGFIHSIRPELTDLANEINYVTDPTDPKQILRVCADLVRLTRTKYTALNLDNHVSKLLGLMILGDETEGIQPILTDKQYNVTHTYRDTSGVEHRLEYAFAIDIKREGGKVIDASVRLLTLLPDDRPRDEDGNLPDYVEMIRIKLSAWKQTAEMRHYDTYLLDPRITPLFAKFSAAYIHRYGKSYLLPASEFRPKPAVPAGERGFATIGAMGAPLFMAADAVTAAKTAAQRAFAGAQALPAYPVTQAELQPLLRQALIGLNIPPALLDAYVRGDGSPLTTTQITSHLRAAGYDGLLEAIQHARHMAPLEHERQEREGLFRRRGWSDIARRR